MIGERLVPVMSAFIERRPSSPVGTNPVNRACEIGTRVARMKAATGPAESSRAPNANAAPSVLRRRTLSTVVRCGLFRSSAGLSSDQFAVCVDALSESSRTRRLSPIQWMSARAVARSVSPAVSCIDASAQAASRTVACVEKREIGMPIARTFVASNVSRPRVACGTPSSERAPTILSAALLPARSAAPSSSARTSIVSSDPRMTPRTCTAPPSESSQAVARLSGRNPRRRPIESIVASKRSESRRAGSRLRRPRALSRPTADSTASVSTRIPPGSSTRFARPSRSFSPANSLVESSVIASGPDGPVQGPSSPSTARAVRRCAGRSDCTRNRRASNRSADAVPFSTRRALSSDVAPENVRYAPSPSSATSSATESPRASALTSPDITPCSRLGEIARPNAATFSVSRINCIASHVCEVSSASRPSPRKCDAGIAPSLCTRSSPANRKSSIAPVRLTRPRRKPPSESAFDVIAPTVRMSSESMPTSSGRSTSGDASRSRVPATVNLDRAPPIRRSSNSSDDESSRHASSGPPRASMRPRRMPSHGSPGTESPRISWRNAKSSGASVTSTSRIATLPPTSAMNRPVNRDAVPVPSSESIA